MTAPHPDTPAYEHPAAWLTWEALLHDETCPMPLSLALCQSLDALLMIQYDHGAELPALDRLRIRTALEGAQRLVTTATEVDDLAPTDTARPVPSPST